MKRWQRGKVTVWKLTVILRTMGVQETSERETWGQSRFPGPSLSLCQGQIRERSLEIKGVSEARLRVQERGDVS